MKSLQTFIQIRAGWNRSSTFDGCKVKGPLWATMIVALATCAPLYGSTMLIDVGHQTASNGTGGVTASPQPNGHYWSTMPAAESTALSLIEKTSGAPTGVTLTLTTTSAGAQVGFTGGGFLNTTAAPGDLNVASAFGDAWFDNAGGDASGSFAFAGLNPALRYELTLWGSRNNNWANGVVNVTTGTAVGGPNFALLQATPLTLTIAPSAGGAFAFLFDDSSGTGEPNSVLNVMRLQTVPEPISLALWVSIGLCIAVGFVARRRPKGVSKRAIVVGGAESHLNKRRCSVKD